MTALEKFEALGYHRISIFGYHSKESKVIMFSKNTSANSRKTIFFDFRIKNLVENAELAKK